MKYLLMTATLLVAAAALAETQTLPSEPPRPPPLSVPPPPEPPPNTPLDTPSETHAQPTVTLIQKGEDKIEEYRMNGRLYMVKVTPKVGAPYYLIDHDGNGTMSRAAGSIPAPIVPQWLIKQY